MHLYKTANGPLLKHLLGNYLLDEYWDHLINKENLHEYLYSQIQSFEQIDQGKSEELIQSGLQPPIGSQEVWAAGVTYLRSRDARMEEAKGSGGADFYDKVYEAERPELFFKALPHRVVGHLDQVCIRKDSVWNVPEPELTLYINSNGHIQAYTIGNDMSSRSIEGENPLYLPQAKVYEKSAALGPCLYVPEQAIDPGTFISIVINRNGKDLFSDSIQLNRMKRSFSQLAEFLFRACDFHYGCFLMTGTGMVPPSEFTLEAGDRVEITIQGIGTLINSVAVR